MFKLYHLTSCRFFTMMTIMCLLFVSCTNVELNEENVIEQSTLDLELGWMYQSEVDLLLPPIESGRNMIITLANGRVQALDKNSGVLQWEYDTGLREHRFMDSAAKIYADEQYVAGALKDNQLFILDASTGAEISLYDLTPTFRRVPNVLIVENVIFIGGLRESTLGYSSAYRIQDGK